jgi:hypothetical protein
MRTITSVVALSVFVSFFVWISALATQTSRDGMERKMVRLHGLPPAK